MGQRFSVDASADTTLITTAETVVATLPGVSTPGPGRSVDLEGNVTVTTGTGTTALELRIRRDSLTGTVVGEVTTDQIEAAAGSTETHEVKQTDANPGEIANATYVLTVSQTGASANGSAVHASLEAEIVP